MTKHREQRPVHDPPVHRATRNDHAVTPGKRTLTMGLPARAPSATPVQRRAAATAPAASAQPQRAGGPVEDWMAVALRPDLHQAPILRKSAHEIGYAGSEPMPAPARGGGAPLPDVVQAKMEQSFGVDFSAVRVHQGPQAPAIGALAYTQGTDIHFAPGQYDPDSQRGQELLGHELAHVVQQSDGRVRASTQAGELAIQEEPALEQEADALGRMAARSSVSAGPVPADRVARADGAIQRKRDLAAPPAPVIQRHPTPADLPLEMLAHLLGTAANWKLFAQMTTKLRLVSKDHRDTVDALLGGNDRVSSLRYWLEHVKQLRSAKAFGILAIAADTAPAADMPELWQAIGAILNLPGSTADEILFAVGARYDLAANPDYVMEAVWTASAAGIPKQSFLAAYAETAALAGIDVSEAVADADELAEEIPPGERLASNVRSLLEQRKSGGFNLSIEKLQTVLKQHCDLLANAAASKDAASTEAQSELATLRKAKAVQDELQRLATSSLKERVVILGAKEKGKLDSATEADKIFELLGHAARMRHKATHEYQDQRTREKEDEKTRRYWKDKTRKQEARAQRVRAIAQISNGTDPASQKKEEEEEEAVSADSNSTLEIRVRWMREQSGSVTSAEDPPKKPLYRHNAKNAGKKYLKWRYQARFPDGKSEIPFYVVTPLGNVTGDEPTQTKTMHAAMEAMLKSQSPEYEKAKVILTKQD